MHLRWLDPEQLSDRDVAGAVAVLESSRQVDSPHQLSLTTTDFVTDVRHGFDGDPAAVAVVRGLPDGRDDELADHETDRTGPVTAVLEVELPHRDNTHLALVRVTVHPAARRRGLGARLFDTAIELARAQGRTLVVVNCWDGTAGVEFAKSMGMDRAGQDVKRTQNLLSIDETGLASLASAARRHAGGYDVVRFAGRTPADAGGYRGHDGCHQRRPDRRSGHRGHDLHPGPGRGLRERATGPPPPVVSGGRPRTIHR